MSDNSLTQEDRRFSKFQTKQREREPRSLAIQAMCQLRKQRPLAPADRSPAKPTDIIYSNGQLGVGLALPPSTRQHRYRARRALGPLVLYIERRKHRKLGLWRVCVIREPSAQSDQCVGVAAL